MPDQFENQQAFDAIAAALRAVPGLDVFQDARLVVAEGPRGQIVCRLTEDTTRVMIESPSGSSHLILVFGWAHDESHRLPGTLAEHVAERARELLRPAPRLVVMEGGCGAGTCLVDGRVACAFGSAYRRRSPALAAA